MRTENDEKLSHTVSTCVIICFIILAILKSIFEAYKHK